MRAVPITTHGGPDVLTLRDVPEPTPSPSTRWCASAPARSTTWISGSAAVLRESCSCNSRISLEATSPARSSTAGRRVSPPAPASSSIPGSPAAAARRALQVTTASATTYGIVGYQSEGGYAELVAVPAANLIAIPDGVTFESAARPFR